MVLRTILSTLLAASTLAVGLAAQSAGGGSVGSGGPSGGPVASPFDPIPINTGTGTPPPDGGVPPDAGTGDNDGNAGGNARAPGQNTRGPSTRSTQGSSSGSRTSGRADHARPEFLDQSDSWLTWWETNKFDFIELHRVQDAPLTGQGLVDESPAERLARLAATDLLVEQQVLPLLRSMTAADDPAVRASAIVALAKVRDSEGTHHAKPLLQDGSFDVRRAAMLAMGVLDAGRSSYLLMHIADDSQIGRKLLDTSSISDNDRGVALLTSSLRSDRTSEILLSSFFENPDDLPDELLASACDAAGLLRAVAAIPVLTEVALDRSRQEFVRSSATSALGRIGDPAAIPSLLSILDSSSLQPRRSATVALGLVAHRGLPEVIDALVDQLDVSDGPTRHFSAISLGRIGGEKARRALLKETKDARSDMRPWLALGLALCERQDPNGEVAEYLMAKLDGESNSESAGAYLIGLGLCGRPAGQGPDPSLPWDRILAVLEEHLNGNSSQVSGQAAIALGLTGHGDAGSILIEALGRANSPEVQRQVALGLGILGNSRSVPQLLELIQETNNPFVASFAALGIAFMGDSDSVGPLIRMIERSGGSGVTATYAVAALGQLFDSERRPALSRLAAGDNYLSRGSSTRQLLDLGF